MRTRIGTSGCARSARWLGRALFTTGGDVAQRLALSRRLILDIGTRVVLPGATLATLQTVVQRIENRARGLGGESSFTEMLTINLIMTALGILIGASLPQRAPTPGELARTANIPEEAARQWLRLADRADQFQSRFAELARDARAGRLTPEQ